MKIKDRYVDQVRKANHYYENIAAYVNELSALGYEEKTLDALKHVIASAHSIVERGQSATNILGHANEVYAAYKVRDSFGEHNKDHFNNILGMTLGGWLKNTLDRNPTLPEIAVTAGVLAGEGMIASQKPEGRPSIWHSLASGALASFWGGTIRSSTIRRLESHQSQLLNQIKQMSDDGRMERLQQFVETSAARKLKFADKKNRKALKKLVYGRPEHNAITSSDTVRRPAARSASVTGPDSRKRDRGYLQGLGPARQPDPDGLAPGRGDALAPSFAESAKLGSSSPALDKLHVMVPGDQADHMESLADVDDFDIYQVAEEAFSSLTLDDWAIIPDDDDPFGGRDPFADGVKWVPGLGSPPSNP